MAIIYLFLSFVFFPQWKKIFFFCLSDYWEVLCDTLFSEPPIRKPGKQQSCQIQRVHIAWQCKDMTEDWQLAPTVTTPCPSDGFSYEG